MRLLRHRTAAFLLVALVVWAAWEAFLSVTAPRRVHPEVDRVLERDGRANVVVTLGFAPEDFHIRLFQSHGVVSGIRGSTVLLNRVGVEDVGRIARYYWVQRIALQ